MNKKIAYFALFTLVLFVATFASAQVSVPNPLSGVNSFADLLCKIAGAIGVIIGALGTIAIFIAAVLYLTSAGNPNKMSQAKIALIAGIIGIVLGLMAKPIVTIIVVDILGASGTSAC